MTTLSGIKSRDIIKVALKLGFRFRIQSGSHAVYTHTDGRKTTIPIHPSQTLGIGLLSKIIKKDFGISKKDFIALTKK